MSKTKKGIKKAFSLSLAVALVFMLSMPASAAKKGASLSILKTDGASVKGELIAVKGRTLILKGEDSGLDISLQLDEISQIIVRKKSKALMGAGIGLLGGALVGAVLLSDSGHGSARLFTSEPTLDHVFDDLWEDLDTPLGASLGALAGTLLGTGTGVALGIDKKYMPADMNQTEQDYLLKKLKSKSRFPQD